MRALIVDDDQHARDYLKATLASELFAVDTASDGAEGSYIARTNDYDILILDHTMPKKSGLEICREVRAAGKNVPILMLTVRSEIDNKTEVLDAGADDYLTKPYSHRELLSRMRALIRRSDSPKAIRYGSGNLILDCGSQEVYVNKKNIYLTSKEFSLLELLLRNKGKVVSRGMIMEHVWDMNGNPFSKTIETHIMNLRKKIENTKQRYIQNVPGRGYKISDSK